MKHKEKPKKIAEIIGWYGAIAVLMAYALVSFKIILANGYAVSVTKFDWCHRYHCYING